MAIKKLLFLSAIPLLAFSFVLAQETTIANEASQAVSQDENVAASDLEVSDPRLLPDNPLYIFKTLGREIQSLFTFNATKKAELREKFSNEKLIELKKIIEGKKSAEAIKTAADNYENEVKKVKEVSDKIKDSARDSAEVSDFLDKFIKQQVLHQRILQKLEEQVPEEVFDRIKEARERHLEKFGEVMDKLEERKDALQTKLEENLEKVEGSRYKNFKNLEVLLELEDKVPERAKEAIRGAQENSLKRLQGDLEKMSPEDQERFKEYLDKVSGDEGIQLEILEKVKSRLEDNEGLKESLIQSRERLIERTQEAIQKRSCPEIDKPDADFCREGRISIRQDDRGCVISFKCTELSTSSSIKYQDQELCAQVITYRQDPENGECKKFSSPCEAPSAWSECTMVKEDDSDEAEETDLINKSLIEPFRKLIPER